MGGMSCPISSAGVIGPVQNARRECNPFDDDFKYTCDGGLCVCGMTQLCGSEVCSNLVKGKWIRASCSGAGLGKMEVREGHSP